MLRKLAQDAWENRKAEAFSAISAEMQERCESAIRSFGRLVGQELEVSSWMEEDGRVWVMTDDGIVFSHARKPHTWWMKGECSGCGEEGWSASFSEDGLWYVGQMLERFEIAGHVCATEEVKEELTVAEQLKEALLRVMREE